MAASDRNKQDLASRLAAFQNREPHQDDPKAKGPRRSGRATVKERHAAVGSAIVVAPKPKKPSKAKKVNTASKKATILKRTLLVTVLLFLLGGLGVGAYTLVAVMDIPEWDPALLDTMKEPSIVYDKDGQEFFRLNSIENRLAFNYEDLPPLLIDTMLALASEDGHTPTSLLAQNAFLGYGGGFQRSIQLAILTSQIERNYTSEEIITAYLMHLIFGNGAFGPRSAAQIYFGKDPAALSITEIALLCGLPQDPGKNDPYADPDRAKTRRTEVLDVMRNRNLITDDQHTQAKDEPFTFVDNVKSGAASINLGQTAGSEQRYFVDYVVSDLLTEDAYEKNLGSGQELAWLIYNGGLRIHTTVDPKIQKAAEDAVKDAKNFPDNEEAERPVQSAIIVLDNATGNVAAMVGGREQASQKRSYNRATLSKRQTGSVASPLIAYAPALEKGGYFAGTVFDDGPAPIDGWTPKNANGRYNGLITMREAIVNPANIYTVKLYQNAGVDYCWDFAKKNLGLDLKESEKTQLNNAIGAFGATPMEITRAYSAFPNLGTIKEPRCVTQIANADNRVLLEAEVKTNRAMKETTAYVVSDMMRSAVTDGNAKEAKLDDWYICGRPGTAPLDAAVFGSRTGTTDAWFAGYSPAYTAVVWTGYDTSDGDHYLSTEYGGEFGGSIPAGMWNQVMGKAHEGLTVQTSLTKPADVMTIKFDAMSGLKPVRLTPAALVKEEIGPGNGSPEGDSDVWIELEVDRNNPNLLAIEGVPSVLKTFLALERGFWSERELPYKPPTQFSSVLDIPRPNINGSYDPGVGGGGQRLLITFRTPVTNWSAFTAVVVLSSTTQGGTSRSIGVDMVNPSTLTVQINPQLTPQQDYQFYVYLRERATGREGGQSDVWTFRA